MEQQQDTERPAPEAAEGDPGLDELLRAVGEWVHDFTGELRAVARTLEEQREETRASLEAQQRATEILLDAVRGLPRRAGAHGREQRADLVRPEVVAMQAVEPVRPDPVGFGDDGGGHQPSG